MTKKPAGHCWQAEVRSVTATAPAGQAWQGAVAPGAALKNPAAQEAQVCADVAPTVELHVPAGHCMQVGNPLARVEKDPAGQLGAGVCEGVRVEVGVCVGVGDGVGELEGVALGVGVFVGVLLKVDTQDEAPGPLNLPAAHL